MLVIICELQLLMLGVLAEARFGGASAHPRHISRLNLRLHSRMLLVLPGSVGVDRGSRVRKICTHLLQV